MKYNHSKIDKKWQEYWQTNKLFDAKDFFDKPKKYVLVEFPYPSGEGLHMGHLRPYVAGDVYSRFLRMKGYEVIYPIGWDAFGLPAENFAIKNGVHPSISTEKNIKNAKKQIQSWGLSFDWSREINTTDSKYYKWTQWIFLQFLKAGLAFESTGLINWCPKDKTGLANEEVIDGCCERCGTKVEKKELRQWYLKITAYAEKMLEGLKTLDKWPEAVKLQQENWIGKSTGAEIDFEISGSVAPSYVLLHGYTGSPEKNFFPWLKLKLEKMGAKVYVPELPSTDDPIVADQVKMVMENIPFDENTVIMGHSLGGIVALKILEKLPKPVKKTVLVGCYSENRFLDENFPEHTFDWKFDAQKIKQNGGEIYLLRDLTDTSVPQDNTYALHKLIGGELFDTKATEPHFCGNVEPEVLHHCADSLRVFTTRPDTIFGATYMVVAPEHEIVKNHKTQITNYEEVEKYIDSAGKKTEIQRTAADKEKTGVELRGIRAINPATKEKIPIFVADYVLSGYGTGAIMAVPAHDERDFEFAKKYNLPIIKVVKAPNDEKLYIGEGKLVNSDKFNGMSSAEALPLMADEFGKQTVQYKLRDWVFSRQRYWGEPIPIIHCPKCGIVPVPEKDLPVILPEVKEYEPTGTGESPLAAIDDWVNVKCPRCGEPAKRETNTMPQWAGSSWYWLRYSDPKNEKELASKKKLEYWQPVDVYFGGMEHTTLHLLYSRFWNLFLYDQGLVTEKEPFIMRKTHGIILAADGEKMSKSRGNVVNPDEIVKEYGADTLRMYELFLGPHEMTVSWNDRGIIGIKRFLDKIWKWTEIKIKNGLEEKDSEKVEKAINKLVKKIGEDIEEFRFNTAVSAYMEFYNEIKDEPVSKTTIQTFLATLYPFAPHICEEINLMLGGKNSVQLGSWPGFDQKAIQEDTVNLVVQINGRVRGILSLPTDSDQKTAEKSAYSDEKVKKYLDKEPRKVIFIKNRLINFVL